MNKPETEHTPQLTDILQKTEQLPDDAEKMNRFFRCGL